MTVCLFPGQGAQRTGMGAKLLDKYQDHVKQANELLGYSLRELILENKNNKLNETLYEQPALYVVECLSYLDYLEKSKNTKPDYVAGHSVGEYPALFAAGVFDFITGLKLVSERSKLMADVRHGGMLAIVGLHKDEIESLLEREGLKDLTLANFNTSTEIILSGDDKDLKIAQAIFEPKAHLCIKLNVSGAFHSRYMEPVAQLFKGYLEDFTLNAPTIPVLSNVTAHPYAGGGDIAKENLVQQIYKPVHWNDVIMYFLIMGENKFHEVEPGGILTNLVKKIVVGTGVDLQIE